MLIMSRTPLRVSFFGGGTDYPEYFKAPGRRGAVVGMAIDKYIHIGALQIDGIQAYRYRVSYSQIERVDHVADIQHNVVRAVLQQLDWDQPLDISVMSDMPASTGLGSSSSFTVGFIKLMTRLTQTTITKFDLARRATGLEHDVLQERVGVQDQLHAAFGGINRFDFDANGTRIQPVAMTGLCQAALTRSLMLIYTGTTRHASATLDEQIERTKTKKVDRELSDLLAMVDEAMGVLEDEDPDRMLAAFGRMMHEGWLIKKSLSSRISMPHIDALYDRAMAHGALGGKLCGAGGGGFLLMVVPEHRRADVVEAVSPAKCIDLDIDTEGSTILYSSTQRELGHDRTHPDHRWRRVHREHPGTHAARARA